MKPDPAPVRWNPPGMVARNLHKAKIRNVRRLARFMGCPDWRRGPIATVRTWLQGAL